MNVMCYNHQSMSGNVEYQAALDYLYSFVDYSMTRSFRWSADKFDLKRMDDLMAALGHPERQYPILHVAGTKGKGSVSAMCESVIRAAGYRVGLYTSPHMHDYAERIRVNGMPIAHQELVELIDEIRPIIESIKELTTFEITTALGFLFFARQRVQAAVIEVGLGGRLDATNITQPVVCVITSISYDHMQILGNTLAEIAGEKAGIIKPGIPVVMAPQHEEGAPGDRKDCRRAQGASHRGGCGLSLCCASRLSARPISHRMARKRPSPTPSCSWRMGNAG